MRHKNIRRAIEDPVVRNAGWLIAGRVARMAIDLLVGLVTARYLGPSNYGLLHYAAAYTAFFYSLCTLGIHGVLVRELVERPQQEGTVLGTALGLQAAASGLSALTIVSISFVADAGEPTTRLVVAAYALSAVIQAFETFQYWFQAKLQAQVTACATLVAYSLAALYKIVLLIRQEPVAYFALATSIEHLCLAALLYGCYRRRGGRKLTFSSQYGRALLKKSCHFILPGLMVAVYGQTDKLMLKHMAGSEELGYYSTAVSVCGAWCFVLGAIIQSMHPPIMEAFDRDRAEFERKNRRLYALVFYLSAAVSLGLTLLGSTAVKLLYGQAYLPAAKPLRILTWYTGFSYLGVAREAWVVCMERQKDLKYIYVLSALVNVAMNLLLIPRWGASGAALASLLAQMSTIIAPFFMKGMGENARLMRDAILWRKK